MAAVIDRGRVAWGVQLPVQAQSTAFVQPWERSAGPAEMASIALATERAGGLYVGVCDHVAIPRDKTDAMSTTWYDTVATLGWLAARTTRIRLLSHVLVLPYRHPLMVAKSFATLDTLSDGRMILGVGAGHVEGEFDVLGVDFEGRGRAVEASIPVLRRAFADEFIEVPGDVGQVVTVGMAPRPAQEGGPPIWVGGSSRVAIRRAALLGDGWLPQGPPKMGTRAAIELIRETRSTAGLPEAFDVGVTGGPVFVGTPDFDVPGHTMSGSAQELAERIARMTSIGINQLQFQFLGVDASQVRDQIERFGAEVAPLL